MKTPKKTLFGKRYTDIKEIGSGGMGNVYRVYDTVRATHLALKELIRDYEDSPSAILRFKNEFRIMSEFQHPNMVRVFDFGLSQENIPFITMEFVAGPHLSDLSTPTVEQAVDILSQLCQVLALIHSRLYVHRDLKPGNIKMPVDGSIKLLDYGLMSQVGVPASGKIWGTYYYLAPEAITGGIIDQSTDLYSLGVIAYELLTGRRPFTGSRKEILRGHLRQIPPEPLILSPQTPPALNAIIMKLLEKDKARRYRNSAAVLEDLQLVNGHPKTVETVAQKHGYLYSNQLIGREQEIALFKEKLALLAQKQSSNLFIGAPGGTGKTRLLTEMKTLAELEEFQTFFLDNRHTNAQIYGRVAALLQYLTPLFGEQEMQRYGQALAQLSQDISLHFPHEHQPAPDETEIITAVVDWFAAVSQKTPVVLFVDDLHETDLKSLSVLNELIRSGQKTNALIVTGFRNDEVEKTSPIWHTVEEGVTQYRQLEPLNAHQISDLIKNLLYPTPVSAEFLDDCFKACGGNVFDLLEFLRYLISKHLLAKSGQRWLEPVNRKQISLPQTLEDRLNQRMSKLNAPAKTLAGVASVLGAELTLENWQTVSSYSEARFFKAIDALIQHQIIVKVDHHHQFSHEKIQHALYNNLPEAQKRDYHWRVATFFEGKLPANRQHLNATIARHFVAAHAGPKAIDYSLRAAQTAEQNRAEWEAFDHYRNAARFLENEPAYPRRNTLLLEIYQKAAQFSSAAWIDASTCLEWLQQAIDFYTRQQDTEKVFELSLSYIVTSAITSNYQAGRQKTGEVIQICQIEEGTLLWAILYGAGVCLVDWYQGHQNDCFDHAVTAIEIFEKQLDTLPQVAWPAYSWALFWRDKARAYRGQPIVLANVEKIRRLVLEGKSDKTIYWHTLTAVGARAAFTGRWADLLEWKQLASQLSREMGKIYWFECWISHSYLYGALHHGEFAQLEDHIERVAASPDPYQVRLAYLFRGRLRLIQGKHQEAEENFNRFFELEAKSPDNSYLEGFIYLAQSHLAGGALDRARTSIEEGARLAAGGNYQNPLYQLQFWQLQAKLAMAQANYAQAAQYLSQSLALAQKMDNPIQQGFIYKAWGLLHHQQHAVEQAREQLVRARDIFLSLENKYQAAQVAIILETVAPPPASVPNEPKTTGPKTTLTEVEAVELHTQTEDEMALSWQKPDLPEQPDAPTENEVTDFEETEPEM